MKYEELNEDQKAKALDQYRQINVDFDEWDEAIRDELKYKVREYGFDDITIRADVSFTQGSGASFTCDIIDLEKYLRKSKQWTKYRKLQQAIKDKELTGSIISNSHSYNHEYTVSCFLSTHEFDLSDDLIKDLIEDINHYVRSECKTAHREMEDFYLKETSDEEVESSIIVNEYDFEVKDTNVTYL